MSFAPWARLSPSQIQEVQTALTQAESKTSGEIVPMIVRRSTPVGYVSHILFWWYLTLMLLVLFFIDSDPWIRSVWPFALLLGMFLPLLLGSLPRVQRWITRLFDREDHVMTRARLEFYEFNVHHTAGATGILIMASMMERRVVVLADEGISKKLPPETWQVVCDTLLEGLRRGQVAEGFVRAIELCGQLLATHFPKSASDSNELMDHFIIKD